MSRTSCRLAWGLLVGAMLGGGGSAQEPQFYQSQVFDRGRPGSSSRWETSAALLFLQPGSGNLEYGTLVNPFPLPTPNWNNQAINPKLTPAFRIGLGYRFDESPNDFQAAWTHLDSTDGASVVGSPDQFVGPHYEIGPDAGIFRIARGTAHFEYDAVNLDVGHTLSSGDSFQVRFFGGVQLAKIEHDLAASFESYDGLTTNGNVTHTLFTGAGPRLGTQARFLAGNFDFLGEIAGSVLAGQMQSRIDFSATSPELTDLNIASPNLQALASPDATQLIPCLDSRLGASYAVPVGETGVFRIEIGYQAAVYINAINRYAISEVVTPPTVQSIGVYLRTQEHLQDNFTVHGPYLEASWAF